MVYTKKVVVKNHTSFFATESESLYSPSPMIQKDKGKGIIDVIEVISCSDSKNTILRTPPHAKGVAIGSLKKKVISQKEKQGQQRRRSDFEEPHLLKDKATKRNSRPTGKTKKVVFGRFRDLKVIKKYGWDILCFVKKQKSTERNYVIKKLKELKDNELKSKSLNSFGGLVHWICMHYVLPKIGTFQEVLGIAKYPNTLNLVHPFKKHPDMPDITFTSANFKGLDLEQNNPMVITIQVAVGYSGIDTLSPYDPLFGFSRGRVLTRGSIKLMTRFGTRKTGYKDLIIKYLVLHASTSYNILLGRPLINAIKAIVSTPHLAMKFPSNKRTIVMTINQCHQSYCVHPTLSNEISIQQRNHRNGLCIPENGLRMSHGQSKAYTYPRDTKTLGCQHGDPNGIIAKTTFGIRSEDRRGSKSEA
ncbi:hypothetical protein JHK84_047782 [Glycine max]|nr:hypothetical protein JHK85_048381 [Glycine max]KAG5102813.1 hypothetical protein JHK84_047782 [Glycine max]